MGCMVRSSTGMRASTKSAPISVNSMPRHCTRVWLQAICISSTLGCFCHNGDGTGGAMVLLAGGFRRLPAGGVRSSGAECCQSSSSSSSSKS